MCLAGMCGQHERMGRSRGEEMWQVTWTDPQGGGGGTQIEPNTEVIRQLAVPGDNGDSQLCIIMMDQAEVQTPFLRD